MYYKCEGLHQVDHIIHNVFQDLYNVHNRSNKGANFIFEEYKGMINFLEECMMISTLLSYFRLGNLIVGIASVTTQILLVDKASQNLASKHKHQLFACERQERHWLGKNVDG